MSPEKQRVAIATALGWQFAYQFVTNPAGEIVSYNSIPDYLNDKNAMQFAKKMLWDKGLMYEFVDKLITCSAKGCPLDRLPKDGELILITNATAEEEAVAFLRTLGLWDDPLPISCGQELMSPRITCDLWLRGKCSTATDCVNPKNRERSCELGGMREITRRIDAANSAMKEERR